MTQQVPSLKPLDDDALFKTLRGLHPSPAQLRDITIVEEETLERLRTPEKAPLKMFGRGRRKKKGAPQGKLHR